jgi:hypothetical protein
VKFQKCKSLLFRKGQAGLCLDLKLTMVKPEVQLTKPTDVNQNVTVMILEERNHEFTY